MLVRLTSSTSGEMIMFSEHARHLFEIVDKECTARGVFTLEQLPEAIQKLRDAVHEEKILLQEAEHKARGDGGGGNASENKGLESDSACIHLCQRACPLIHLMEWTQKEKGFILWEADQDF